MRLDRRAALRRLIGFVAASPLFAQEGSDYPPQYAEEVMGPVNLHEFEAVAKKKLHKMAYDFIAGGVEDEVTLRANRASFECLRLIPRVMRDVSTVDPSVTLLGTKLPAPILLAPTGGKNLILPGADLVAARAAAHVGCIYSVGGAPMDRLEDEGIELTWWSNSIGQADKEAAQNYALRMEDQGASALILTVDNQYQSNRDRNNRNRFDYGYMSSGVPGDSGGGRRASPAVAAMFRKHTPNLTWDWIEWVRQKSELPIVIKGVLDPEDAEARRQPRRGRNRRLEPRCASARERDCFDRCAPGHCASGGRQSADPDGRRRAAGNRHRQSACAGRDGSADRAALFMGSGVIRPRWRAARLGVAGGGVQAGAGARGQDEAERGGPPDGPERAVRVVAVPLFLLAGWVAQAQQPLHEVCGACHTTVADDFRSHKHASVGLDCSTCHGESLAHRNAAGAVAPDRVAAPHPACRALRDVPRGAGEGFLASRHGELVQANERAPNCGTCHDVHRVRSILAMKRRCVTCHKERPEACAAAPAEVQFQLECANCHTPHEFRR
ncbi:MAG: alpha-hydroxy acid oxidase [Bryobacterales bacterium]